MGGDEDTAFTELQVQQTPCTCETLVEMGRGQGGGLTSGGRSEGSRDSRVDQEKDKDPHGGFDGSACGGSASQHELQQVGGGGRRGGHVEAKGRDS